MIIIPSIDIMDGECVRLTKGEFSARKVYSADPLAMAKKFERQGATMMHVVDLDGAKSGKAVNQELIISIAKSIGMTVEAGGGVRDMGTARKYLNGGIQKIVIGTKAVTAPDFIASLIREFGSERIVAALEIKNGRVAVNGWQKTIDKNYLGFAGELRALGVTQILFTDISRDGTLTKPNFAVNGQLADLGFNVIASGGISDLQSLGKLNRLGLFGAILGKALYENKIDLREAINFVKPKSNLAKRIIPCLDVRDGKVVKGIRFRGHVVIGDIVNLARRYCREGADELVFYDITASTESRTVSTDWVKRAARVINIPFCVAGGITSVDDARKILQTGADKISINSPALENPDLINKLAAEFGSQSVVVGIDSFEENGSYFVKQYTGDPAKTRATAWRTIDWAVEAQKRGAGEIVFNCMNRDGVRAGYDIRQLKKISEKLTIPLVASGGAGTRKDFLGVFLEANVEGALAASVFHSGDIFIPRLKKYLSANNISIRL